MFVRAEDYEWSSARAHFAGQDLQRLLGMAFWRSEGGRSNWLRLLNAGEEETQCRALRRATCSGQPVGDEDFTERMRALRQELARPAGPCSDSAGEDQEFAATACGTA